MWGGDTPMVQISALKGENIDELLETVMLVAELHELKANPHRNAKGTVIDAGLDKSKGPVATLIVQNGTLKRGDVVVCGEAFGEVRAMFDDRGSRVDEAGPSMAVQVIGLSDVPIAGDEFKVVSSLDVARERAEARADSLRIERISAKAGEGKVTLSSIAAAVSAGKQSGIDRHQLNIILKVDVQLKGTHTMVIQNEYRAVGMCDMSKEWDSLVRRHMLSNNWGFCSTQVIQRRSVHVCTASALIDAGVGPYAVHFLALKEVF